MKYFITKYNDFLINASIRPYKTVTLQTGLIVDHYKNGKLIADKRITRGRKND